MSLVNELIALCIANPNARTIVLSPRQKAELRKELPIFDMYYDDTHFMQCTVKTRRPTLFCASCGAPTEPTRCSYCAQPTDLIEVK
jgi:hypothetical protein